MAENRPYRVGMARPNQRYIEPDAIYPDLRRGERTSIPAQFPFTWNPVNGLGAPDVQSQGFLDDVFNAVIDVGKDATKGVIDDGKKSAEDRAKQGIEELIRSGAGKALLEAVEAKAADGVTKVVKQQGVNLILLAVAGGAVGGVLSEKLGKMGTVLAIATAGWAGMQILKGVAPPPPAPKKR